MIIQMSNGNRKCYIYVFLVLSYCLLAGLLFDTAVLALPEPVVAYSQRLKSNYLNEYTNFEIHIDGFKNPKLCSDGKVEIDVAKVDDLTNKNPKFTWGYSDCETTDGKDQTCQTDYALWPLEKNFLEFRESYFEFFPLSKLLNKIKEDTVNTFAALTTRFDIKTQKKLLKDIEMLERLFDMMRPKAYPYPYYGCITSIADTLSQRINLTSYNDVQDDIKIHVHLMRLRILKYLCSNMYSNIKFKDVALQLNNWITDVKRIYRPNGNEFGNPININDDSCLNFFRDSSNDLRDKLKEELDAVRMVMLTDCIKIDIERSFDEIYSLQEAATKEEIKTEINNLLNNENATISFLRLSNYFSKLYNYYRRN